MEENEKIRHYLETHFPQFDNELKEKLIEEGVIKRFDADETMMSPGQYFRSTMLIVDGKVKLYRQGEAGGEFFLYYIEPGGACALSMICASKQEKSEVMGKAVEETTALLVPVRLMDELMTAHKAWYHFVLETYRARYEELLQMVDNIVFKNMDERLMFYLKHQYETSKSRQLNITHQQVANDLNSSREVISRLLKKMEQRGELVLNRNSIDWKL